MKINIKSTGICFVISAATIFVTGCNYSSGKKNADGSVINQENLCVTQSKDKATNCEAGQKVVFVPNSWGSEQLPIIFAALNCDLRYSVVMTNGGVTCIYVGDKKSTSKEEKSGDDKTSNK